jgi:hypothetical protein
VKEKNTSETDLGKSDKPARCELCGSSHDYLNFHHLIPKTLHANKVFKRKYTRKYMENHGIWICKSKCHKQIHVFTTEKELGTYYYTIEPLLTHPEIKKYIEWRSVRVN